MTTTCSYINLWTLSFISSASAPRDGEGHKGRAIRNALQSLDGQEVGTSIADSRRLLAGADMPAAAYDIRAEANDNAAHQCRDGVHAGRLDEGRRLDLCFDGHCDQAPESADHVDDVGGDRQGQEPENGDDADGDLGVEVGEDLVLADDHCRVRAREHRHPTKVQRERGQDGQDVLHDGASATSDNSGAWTDDAGRTRTDERTGLNTRVQVQIASSDAHSAAMTINAKET